MKRDVRNIWAMLLPEQRRAFWLQLALIVAGMIIETLSTAAVLPVLALMSQPDFVTRNPWLGRWLQYFGNPDRDQLVLVALLLLVALVAIKAVFLGLVSWRQARFVARLQATLSERLFVSYLRQPYPFHLRRNSAELLSHIANVSAVSSSATTYLALITEALIIVGVAILLIAVEPIGSLLVVAVLGIAGYAFQFATRASIRRSGETRWLHGRLSLQHQTQALGGVKDVKLLGREDDLIAQFQLHARAWANAGERQTTLQSLPRLWLELLAVSGMAGLVIVIAAQGKPLQGILPTLGVFAVAAFRIMPSFHRVLGSVQGVRHYAKTVDVLHREMMLANETLPYVSSGRFDFHDTLAVRDLSFQYEGAARETLTSVQFSILRGSTVGFIGTSGSGKSTLIDIILGLLQPSSGAVLVDGRDIRTNLRGWQDQIGYVSQPIYLTDDTLRRNIAFGLAPECIDDAAVWRSIHAAQLTDFVRSLPDGLSTVVGERGVRISGGQRQRLGIARALYHDPAVLVLDEATNALDQQTEQGIMDAVYALSGGKTILMVAHRLSTVARCDRLFRVDGGRVVETESLTHSLHVG